MPERRFVALALASCAALGAAREARAQGNDRSAPTGGRTALMGNAGIALSRDGAAPFLNPATIVRIGDESLAFSVNFYTFALTHYSDWHQPTPADPRFGNVALQGTGISTTRFTALPSTLCLFFTLAGIMEEIQGHDVDDPPSWKSGRQKLAICVGSVESEDVSLPALAYDSPIGNGSTAQVESLARRWNRLHVGPTYSAQITDALAVGASIHGVYSSTSFIIDGSSITGTAGAPIQSTLGAAADGHSLDLAAIVGATLRAGRFTVGASAQAPSLHLEGAYEATLHDEYAGAGGGSATLTSGSGDFTAKPPVRLGVGIGAQLRKLTVEIDETYEFALTDVMKTSLTGQTSAINGGAGASRTFDATYTVRSRPVWNTAVGAEYFVTQGFSVIGGASTNFSTTPALAPTMSLGNLVQARQHSVALSFGVGSYGDAGNLLLGAQLGYGWGQAMAVNPYVLPNDWAVVDTQSYSALLILAGATNLRAISRAVERVENAVTKGKPDAPGK